MERSNSMSTLESHSLECLAAIVEEGGFERAARKLNLTQSAVSQRLCGLEAQVGTVLIVRSRPLKATEAGQLLIKHAKQRRLLHADIALELRELAPSGSRRPHETERISIAIDADSIASWALPSLTALIRSAVPLEIISDDQDFTEEWLRTGQVVGCVTTSQQPLNGCKIFPLGAMRYVAVAHPDLIAQRLPDGLTPYNFREVPFVAVNRKGDTQSEFVSQCFGLERVALHQLYVPSSEVQLQAILAGWGVGVIPELLAREWLEKGALVNLALGEDFRVQLYWHCWSIESDVLETLTNALVSSAAKVLE